jgi:nucleotide-binding universal stress UspA family protein
VSARLTIAYDGSHAAATAVRAATALFGGAEATVVTVPAPPLGSADHVRQLVPTMSSEALQRTLDELAAEASVQARAVATEGAARATAAGLRAEARDVAPHAPPWEALLAAAAGSDALVCGARGRSGFARALLGSTSTSLLHHAALPVVIVPEGAGTLAGPALIAYDGSAAAREAIATAGRLLTDRPVVVVHVYESQFRRGATIAALRRGEELRGIVDELDSALTEGAAATTAEGVELARAAGLDATGETVESESGVWRSVTSLAKARDASLVVTGARGIGGARSALLGSVSSGLVHNAEVPVLVVHAPPE